MELCEVVVCQDGERWVTVMDRWRLTLALNTLFLKCFSNN